MHRHDRHEKRQEFFSKLFLGCGPSLIYFGEGLFLFDAKNANQKKLYTKKV